MHADLVPMKRWAVVAQRLDSGERFEFEVELCSRPTMEEAAILAMSQVPDLGPLSKPVPVHFLTPRQALLEARGYRVMSVTEAS